MTTPNLNIPGHNFIHKSCWLLSVCYVRSQLISDFLLYDSTPPSPELWGHNAQGTVVNIDR